MNDNSLGKTWYNDLSVGEMYKNFLVKYPVFKIVRILLLGFFGFFYKMVHRINRTIRDPETKQLNMKYTIILFASIAIVIFAIVGGIALTISML